MSVLRETDQSPEDKLKALLKIREAAQLKQQNRNANALFEEEEENDGQEESESYGDA